MAEELAQAARYVQSLLPEPLAGDVRIDWRFVPSTQLGGDMFGYHRIDADHLAVYLLDVSGHGVGSSLLAVSASNIISSQALPNTDFRDPGQVMSRLNDVFQMEKQNGKYFTIWYGVCRHKDRSLAFSNAGHPPPLLWMGPAADRATLHPLKAKDPFIGMLPPGMEWATQVVPLESFARLLIYSDGAYEISRPGSPMWTHREFVEFLDHLPRDGELVCDRLQAQVRQLHGSEILDDDFSVMEIRW